MPGNTQNSLLETKNGQVWVVSPTAISLFNRQQNNFTNYTIPFKLEFNNLYNIDDQIIDLHERSNGEIMWGDSKRMFFFNPKNKTFRTIDLPKYFIYGIKRICTSPDSQEYIEAMGETYRYTDAKGFEFIYRVPMSNPAYARFFLIDKVKTHFKAVIPTSLMYVSSA